MRSSNLWMRFRWSARALTRARNSPALLEIAEARNPSKRSTLAVNPPTARETHALTELESDPC